MLCLMLQHICAKDLFLFFHSDKKKDSNWRDRETIHETTRDMSSHEDGGHAEKAARLCAIDVGGVLLQR